MRLLWEEKAWNAYCEWQASIVRCRGFSNSSNCRLFGCRNISIKFSSNRNMAQHLLVAANILNLKVLNLNYFNLLEVMISYKSTKPSGL